MHAAVLWWAREHCRWSSTSEPTAPRSRKKQIELNGNFKKKREKIFFRQPARGVLEEWCGSRRSSRIQNYALLQLDLFAPNAECWPRTAGPSGWQTSDFWRCPCLAALRSRSKHQCTQPIRAWTGASSGSRDRAGYTVWNTFFGWQRHLVYSKGNVLCRHSRWIGPSWRRAYRATSWPLMFCGSFRIDLWQE